MILNHILLNRFRCFSILRPSLKFETRQSFRYDEVMTQNQQKRDTRYY